MKNTIPQNRKWISGLTPYIVCGMLGTIVLSQSMLVQAGAKAIKAEAVADAVTFAMGKQNVTLVNGPAWVTGKSGTAVNLDGLNDYVSLPAGIVSSLKDFTISVWVKLDTRAAWNRIFDLGTGTEANMFLTPQSDAAGIRYAITTGGNGSEQQIDSSTALPTGVWKHVAVTQAGKVAILYVDGVEVGRNSNMTLNPSSLGSTTANYIGRSQYDDPYLDGQVDSFKIYNRALSATEVASQFSGSPIPSTATPTATPATTASTTPSDSYQWNYGNVPSATKETWNDNPTLTPINLNPYGKPSLTIPYGYILLSEGPKGTSQVSKDKQTAILKRINEDLKWESTTLGIQMPRWSTGKTGAKYIDYFFTNTGLPNDPGATGDQSWEGSYPFVESDSNGMSDQNRYNITHEFNHVLLNAYGTVPGESVSWIQESLNDYLILRLAEWRSGATPGQSQQFAYPSGIGYLDAEVFKQPYVPIESCGINSSGEATGPSDYYNDSTGFRYNDLFPLFVSQRVGMTFYAKVFEAAKTSEQNLQTMTRLLDKARVQSMVTEYAARLALGDFMEFSNSVQGLASTSMYAATTNQNGWLVPSNTNKLPRYTGRNNIPISVSSGATEVTVNFAPDTQGSNGTTADMRAQIVYRATDGTAVFSTPVSSGQTTIKLTKAPKYGVVTVVISNVTMSGYKKTTSYGWDPTEKFGYKIQVIGGTAAATTRLYF